MSRKKPPIEVDRSVAILSGSSRSYEECSSFSLFADEVFLALIRLALSSYSPGHFGLFAFVGARKVESVGRLTRF